jgi:toxin FitB
MPPAHRLAPTIAAELLDGWFPHEETLAPSAELVRGVVRLCSERGVAGGAVYDALVALTAREADALLLTRDARAARSYERVGVRFELVP